MSDDAPPAANALELRDVVKVYEGGVRALDGVSLEVGHGEFLAITGPSGCGKSTMLGLVAALDTPTSGTILVGGHDLRTIRNLSRFRRQEVGLVFQLHNLLTGQPVIANIGSVMFGTDLAPRDRRARAMDLLAQVDLKGREDRMPTQLSGGERQRVAIARALANSPKLLLADEPTGSLDSDAADTVMKLFQGLRANGVTILLVTHDATIAALADRTVPMRDGRILECAPSAARAGGDR
jgi:putative ABC transport system ATP-binding protein